MTKRVTKQPTPTPKPKDNSPSAVCARLYQYICFFLRRIKKQPYCDLCLALDFDWRDYVYSVNKIINAAQDEVHALLEASGSTASLTAREVGTLLKVAEEINALDERTPDDVFLPPYDAAKEEALKEKDRQRKANKKAEVKYDN